MIANFFVDVWNGFLGLNITVQILIGFGVAFGLGDLFVVYILEKKSFSKELLRLSKQAPIIALAVGVAIGHIFWPQKRR